MKVVLVTHDSAFGRYVAASLAARCRIDRIIVETSRATTRFYWRKLWRVGPVNFVFQFFLNRWFGREGRRLLPACTFPPHERVVSVNDVTFAEDELVLGFGTSYVTARTLAKMPRGFLNLHTGVLPHYRGVKSEFWALYNGDHANLGWTLHYMTPQLDAGDVVASGHMVWDGQHPAAVRAVLLQCAVPAIATFVTNARHNPARVVERIAQDEYQARYYSTPTWREWRKGRLAWAKRRTKL